MPTLTEVVELPGPRSPEPTTDIEPVPAPDAPTWPAAAPVAEVAAAPTVEPARPPAAVPAPAAVDVPAFLRESAPPAASPPPPAATSGFHPDVPPFLQAVAPTPATAPARPLPTDEQLVQSVLTDLQRQIDLMLDYRLREAIAPALTRAADALVREMRADLASTLREVVARAVSQELARHRQR